jgi:hypothetical protein
MTGVSGCSAADRAKNGTSAKITMAAAAEYRPARGPVLISVCDCSWRGTDPA